MNMKIIDVFQPVHTDINGWRSESDELFDNEEEARKHCTGHAGLHTGPKKYLGLQLEDGKVYIFQSTEPVRIYHTTDEMKKERALAKLSSEEKKLLGH